MLKLYYARPSLYARPVWLALLEKGLPFDLVHVDLSGKQFEPEFLAINPFGHIPVLFDGDFRVIESQAILDYLDAKYPMPSLLPRAAETLATVRMVQFIGLNELLPAIASLLIYPTDTPDYRYGHARALNTLTVLESMLTGAPFVAGEQLTMAEVVTGSLVPVLLRLEMSLAAYPHLSAWTERLLARPAWQTIQLSDEEWSRFRRQMRVVPKVWHRRRRQRAEQLQAGQSLQSAL